MTTVLQALNAALLRAMTDDPRVLLLGEDILDPYGGAFKVTRGLSTAFPERVLTTPISEAAITGLAGGMALRGLRPVVELMFGDFITLATDQLINHISKFRWMYNEQVSVPMVVRTPMGGRRGYGPTHSQTLEKLFLGQPGLRVLAPVNLDGGDGGPGELLYRAICAQNDPVLFVENKLQYLLPICDSASLDEFHFQVSYSPARLLDGFASDFSSWAPFYRLAVKGAPSPVLTLATYGYMSELARQAAWKLAYENEIFIEVIIPTQLAPFQIEPLLEAVAHTRRMLVVEESSGALGWGAEVAALAIERYGSSLQAVRRLAGKSTPVPASPRLEWATLPQLDDILVAIKKMVAINS